VLGELSVREFLARHWQKRPLLVRGAFRDWPVPVTLQELFVLARESGVASRLIRMPGPGRNWDVQRGPFLAEELESLPESGWTLLVQEIDRRIGGFRDLLDRFRFIPNWRIDDVMVSYAPDGGGVGPHIDRYDVFLLQAAGHRRWRIASDPLAEERLLPEVELPVLAQFEPDREWTLEPGDMLYLPPRIAHEGVAVGHSITCSVGFRAPDPRELCSGFLRQLSPAVFDGIRYSDPELEPAEKHGEIPPWARRQLRESAQRLFSDSVEFDRWLGRFVTTPQRDEQPSGRTRIGRMDELSELLERGGELKRSAAPHFAWHGEADGSVQLFVGGERYDLGQGTEATAEFLCGRERLDHVSLGPLLGQERFAGVLVDLVLRGFLVPDESVDDGADR
jgi:50S ribosomal protein L16 3-hydroxylase